MASSSLRAARAVSLKLSPEPDEELILSFLDKSVLIVVWTIAIIYSVMSPSIIRYIRNSLRSDDDRIRTCHFHRDADSHYFCDLREDWSSEAGEMRDIQGKL